MAKPGLRLQLRRAGRRLLFLTTRTLVRIAGFHHAYALGAFIGGIRFSLGGKPRRRMQQELAHALEMEAGHPAVADVLRQSFRINDGAVLEIMAALDSRRSDAELAQRSTVEGLEHLRAALHANRGAILLAAHMGNQALAAMELVRLGFAVSVVYKQSRMGSAGFLHDGLERYGVQAILANEGIKAYGQMLGALKKGRVLVIMLDQGVKHAKDGIVLRFLGKDMPMPAGPAQLARVSRAPVLPLATVNGPPVWKIAIGEPVPLGHATLEEDLQALLRAAERQIVRFPQHWSWHHRRWRNFRPAPRDATS